MARTHTAISFITIGVVVIFGIVALVLYDYDGSAGDIEKFIPDSTVLALQISRDVVFDAPHSLFREHSSLATSLSGIKEQWALLEDRMPSRVIYALWLVTEGAGERERHLVFELQHKPTAGEREAIDEASLAEVSFLQDSTAVVRQLSETVFVLTTEDVAEDFFASSHAFFPNKNEAPIVFYFEPRVMHEADEALRLGLPYLSFTQFVSRPGNIRGYLESSDGQLRIGLWQNIPDRELDAIDSSLRLPFVPPPFDFVVAHPLSDFIETNSNANALVKYIGAFFDRLSHTFFVPARTLESLAKSFHVLVLDNESWLVADDERVSVERFAHELTSIFSPHIREGTLPDGTTYREYVRAVAEPSSEEFREYVIRTWHSPVYGAIYLADDGTRAYVSNDFELLSRIVPELGRVATDDDSSLISDCLGGDTTGLVRSALAIRHSERFELPPPMKAITLFERELGAGIQEILICIQ